MRTYIILAFTLLSLIIESCCDENDSYSGVIISVIDLDFINYTNLNLPHTGCIQTDSSYKSLVTEPSLWDEMPLVDFTKQSVLINYKHVNNRIFCDRNVIIDSIKKNVTYTVFAESCNCMDKCKNYDYNIVIVPKIGSDFKILYK